MMCIETQLSIGKIGCAKIKGNLELRNRLPVCSIQSQHQIENNFANLQLICLDG